MLRLTLPTERDRENVLDLYREFETSDVTPIGAGNSRDYDAWLRGMENRHTGTDLPEGYVRENFYLCYEGETLCGVFSLKFSLTDFLLNYGGHIGYAVRPSMQNRGLATEMLREGLRLAKDYGFDRVLCVCDEDNLASEKVILKNGGVLEDIRYDADEKTNVKRYWISLA